MPSIVQPTYSAGTYDTVTTLSGKLIANKLLDAHDIATPTSKILLNHKRSQALGPDEVFRIPIKTKDVSPHIGHENDRFPTEDIDNVTEEQWSPVIIKTGAGTNDDKIRHYKNPTALMDHIAIKVDSMHAGLTKVLNWAIFSDWAATITNREIDVSAALTSLPVPPEELYLKNVSEMTDLPWSLPMAARKTVTGHTFGNVATTTISNYFWQPEVTDATGITPTRSSTAPNIDVVTSELGGGVAVALTHDALMEHLDKMQSGQQYELLVPTPRRLFQQLRGIVMAANIRQVDSPLADLGIKGVITWEEYNATFYSEPMMSALWPNSMFFFDPECFYWETDEGADPTEGSGIYPWERIPGTTIHGAMVRMLYNFVCEDRRGVGAMHGYTWDS